MMFVSSRQRGAVLITGLIFLVVLTLLAVAGMRTTILEEKMAGNARDADIAFQAAEAALKAGEQVLTQPALPNFAAGTAYLPAGKRTDTYWLSTHNWTTQSVAYVPSLAGTNSPPQFVIEQMASTTEVGGSLKFGAVTESGIYRITARGTGGNPNTRVHLQATYRR